MNDKQKTNYGEPFNPYRVDTFAPAYECLLKSSLSDSDKLFLIKLYQYGGKDGKAFPKRKSLAADLAWSTSKLDKVIKSLKGHALIKTMKTGTHSSNQYIFLFHEIYDLGKDPVKTKVSKFRKEVHLNPEAVELIEYWNKFATLTTHRLNGEQSKTVQELNDAIPKLLKGEYYTDPDHKEVQTGLRSAISDEQIKTAIERMAKACGPDYNSNGNLRMTFSKFIHNPRARIGRGKDRYRYKYPLLHFIHYEPVPLCQKPSRRKTEYEGLVNRLITKMPGPNPASYPDSDYNKVVTYVEKAVSQMETFKPAMHGETSNHLKRRIPELIYDSMDECGKGHGVGQLGLAVSRLEEMMRRRLIIR